MSEEIFENKTFTYPLIFKLLFRYGNFVVTLFLIVYIIPMFYYLDQNTLLIVPLLISLLVIYVINRHYFNIYKIVPFKIEADKEKITCSEFIFSKKTVTIFYKDIDLLSGGIFENKISGIMKVCDGKNSICIGFYQKLSDSNKLITIILSKVKKQIYDDVIDRLTKKGKK